MNLIVVDEPPADEIAVNPDTAGLIVSCRNRNEFSIGYPCVLGHIFSIVEAAPARHGGINPDGTPMTATERDTCEFSARSRDFEAAKAL